MRRTLVVMVVLVALGIVGGVSAADTGPLPGPLENQGGEYTWPGAVTLQTTPYPWGGGYVVSAGAYINCPFACIRPFAAGASVSLEAHPTPGWLFTGWAVANHGQAQLPGICPGTGTCAVTIDQAKDVVANFVIDPNGPLAPKGEGVPNKKPKPCGGGQNPRVEVDVCVD